MSFFVAGEFGVINMAHSVSDLELIEELKPWLIDREKLNLSILLGSGQFGKVFKGSIQLPDGKHRTVAVKTLKGNTTPPVISLDSTYSQCIHTYIHTYSLPCMCASIV